MLIDFHVHFFPDSIAQRTTMQLSESANITAVGDGSVHSLIRNMEDEKIDISVNLPVATKPDQVMNINRKMIEFNANKGNIISFGAMHPDFQTVGDVDDELEYLYVNGIKGIKLHPEYQSFYPDDDKMIKIYETCRKLGLIVIIHSGRDIAYESVHATPKRLAEVAKIKSLKLVLAHMAGFRMWDEVEEYLMGAHGVYFDTAYVDEMENWQLKEIILGHGAYKILFGSDFPWQRPSLIVDKIKSLGLGKDFEEMIFYKNAKQLLGINS